jgi:hypothetical protein
MEFTSMGVYEYDVLKLKMLHVQRAQQRLATAQLNLLHATNAVEDAARDLKKACEPETCDLEIPASGGPFEDGM